MSATANINAKVQFMQAAVITAKYDPMDPSKVDAPAPTEIASATAWQKLHLNVTGLPGETVYMTCNVTNPGNASAQRDCGGNNGPEQHAIHAGHPFDNGILLTNDLMPNPSGKSESSVNIEISYI